MSRHTLIAWILLAAIAHVALFLPLPHWLQATAALALLQIIPGALAIEALLGRTGAPLGRWERGLYTIGAGIGIQVTGLMLLAYIPGPLARSLTLIGFDILIAALAAWLWARPPRPTPMDDAAWPTLEPTARRPWLIAGLLSLLVVGAALRLPNLGYAEFQGDEARAALRSAAVIQGYDDILLVHRKGPTEILLPTGVYVLTGHLTEASARLPFAIANLAGLFAVFLLGWRLFGPVAGWSAAMFLALDGYLIAFARILQYQSVVFLTSVAAVLVLTRLTRQPMAMTRYLTLAAWLLVTGLFSHYEAALAFIPIAILLGTLIWQNRSLAAWARALAAPLAVGAITLASFYVPFFLHPNFYETYVYLSERRVGGSFPYNNFADFFARTVLYTPIYAIALLTLLALATLAIVYRRGLGRRWGSILTVLAALLLALTAWNDQFLNLGGHDWLMIPWALVLLSACCLPRLRPSERAVLAWWSGAAVVALFLIAKPRTHVYTFFPAWTLVAGWALEEGWRRARASRLSTIAQPIGLAAAAGLIVVCGYYAYAMYIDNQPERLRTYAENRLAGYPVPFDQPPMTAIFGFPLANGWKAVGALYAQGQLAGDYGTTSDDWVSAWYTRGQRRCERTASWYFLTEELEPYSPGEERERAMYLQDFARWGVVMVNDTPKMSIYQRTTDALPEQAIPLEELARQFDAQLSGPDLPLRFPTIPARIGHRQHLDLGGKFWFEGYDLEHPTPLHPGDPLRVYLYWTVQDAVLESYTVFVQVRQGDQKIAQIDSIPLCANRPTFRWKRGEIVVDPYDLQINPDAQPGTYTIYAGMYLAETGERLEVLDAAGNPVRNEIAVAEITIE